MGFDKLGALVEKWEGIPESASRYNLKLFADKETYEAMDALARIQDKNAHQLAIEIVRTMLLPNKMGKTWTDQVFFCCKIAKIMQGDLTGDHVLILLLLG
ncbi:transcriptional regulatory protein [Datura stramonium]|uniref:Transcriptional regulatory protein n=1 Tax=Datura stramonium TaxID=4076 RepID=A0ABS8T2R3_DATST|nr:transcriptional regulatory protein [Datura stramonium]